MERDGYQADSEWPAEALPVRMRHDVLITAENGGKKTVFLTDGLGNVLLADTKSYELYEEHLEREEEARKSA